jgi:phytoene dehydrogenase-like protein
MSNPDILVVGAGHNGLTTAAYLAKAGLRVQVLEAQPWLGGGVSTDELTVPGFLHDRHSTAHVFIQANPMLQQDELGLKARFGLRYVYPDSPVSTIFEDGTSIITYTDVERTCDSIARISPKDADAYRKFAAQSASFLPMITAGMFVPPPPVGPFTSLLEQSTEGRMLLDAMGRSIFDLVTERFSHEKVIVHLLRFAAEGFVSPEEKGTGLTMFTMPGFTHTYPAGVAVGGSGALTQSLARCIEHYGGAIRLSARVEKILTQNGRAAGVRLSNGETLSAKRAVLGTIHPYFLKEIVENFDEDLGAKAARVHLSSYATATSHYALKDLPRYRCGGDAGQALLAGLTTANLKEFRRVFDSFRYGEIPDHLPLTAIVNTQHDPSRAPEGKHTLYLWTWVPFDLANEPPDTWDKMRDAFGARILADFRTYTENMTDDNILGQLHLSPLDMQRSSPSFQKSDVHGIGPFSYQFGGHRPTPELASYAIPGIDGLYLTGCFMHPGGGVMGGGRATAIKMLEDFGIAFDRLVAA